MALASPSLVVGSFDPERVLDLIERCRVTMFAGIPTMFRMLLGAGARERDLSSVRLWGGGGDAFSFDLVREFRDLPRRAGGRRAAFVTGYGLAETAGQLTVQPLSGRESGCVGWFLPGTKTRILDESGRDVRRGEVGELVVKTPSLMREYWQDPEATARAMVGGWFKTGDLMKRDRFGLHYFMARDKDMIKVGGYSVFPAEVEAILDRHPAIEQSVVVGLPHAIKGSLPVAVVVLRDGRKVTEREILAWAKTRVARYRCPRRILIRDAIPLNQAMKPLRRQVRADLLSEGITAKSFAEQDGALEAVSA
jgi:long-chain acyl-CoA synthetase